MKRNFVVGPLILVCAVAALIFVAQFAAPRSAFLSERTLLVAAGWIKLVSLVVAALFAFRVVGRLDRENPARFGWLALAVGLAAFSLGQATLTSYQTFRGTSPFPSSADIWFMISYPVLIVALVSFSVTYAKSGFPTEGITPVAVGVFLFSALLAWPLLRPIVQTPAPALVTILNIAYPTLDLILLVPAVVLLWITSRFRGGAIWRVWLALLIGFVFTAIGDIAFAWFSTLGLSRLDPLIHAIYICAYGSLAVGASIQYQVLAPE